MGDWYTNVTVRPEELLSRIEHDIKTQETQRQLNCMMSNQLVYEKKRSEEHWRKNEQLRWKLQKSEEKIMELQDHIEDLKESCEEYKILQNIQNTQLEDLRQKLWRQQEDYLKFDREYKTKELYIEQQTSIIKDLESSVEINRNSKDEYMRLVEDVVRQNKMLTQQRRADVSLNVCDQSSNTDDPDPSTLPTETVDGSVQTCLPTIGSPAMCSQQTQTEESAAKISQHCQCDLNPESDASDSVRFSELLADCWSLCDSAEDLARGLATGYEAKILYCRQAVHESLAALRIKGEENELLRRACAESKAVVEDLREELERVRRVASSWPTPVEPDVAEFTTKLLAEAKRACLDITRAAEEMETTAKTTQVVPESDGELRATNDADTVAAGDKIDKCRPAKRGKRHEKAKCEKKPSQTTTSRRHEKRLATEQQNADDPTAALGDLLTNVVPELLAKIRNDKTSVVRRANLKVLLSKIAATGFGSLTFQELSFLHHKIIENSVEHYRKYKSLIEIATRGLPSWQRGAMSTNQDIVHMVAIMEGVEKDYVNTSSAVKTELVDIKDLLVATVKEKQNIEKTLAKTKADNERLLKKSKKSQWTHGGCFQERNTCMKSCMNNYLRNMSESEVPIVENQFCGDFLNGSPNIHTFI